MEERIEHENSKKIEKKNFDEEKTFSNKNIFDEDYSKKKTY